VPGYFACDPDDYTTTATTIAITVADLILFHYCMCRVVRDFLFLQILCVCGFSFSQKIVSIYFKIKQIKKKKELNFK